MVKQEARKAILSYPLVASPILLIFFVAWGIDTAALPARAEPASFELPKSGEKFFPIGLWGAWPMLAGDPTDYYQRMQLHFPDMKAAGFNMTNLWVSSNPSSANLQKAIDTLNAAEANGVYLKIRIHEFVRYQNWPTYRSNLETFINAVEQHNALLCYDSVDEPELGGEGGVLLMDLVDMKNWVGLKDAYNRRVWCNQADIIQVQASGEFTLTDPNDTSYADGVNTIKCAANDFDCFYPLYGQWATEGNVFSMDIYPVGHPYHEASLKLNAVSEGFKIHRDHILPLTGLFNPPQGFVLQAYSVTGTSPLPTFNQSRFMAFDVITQGSKSIEWWGQGSRLDIENDPEDIACWQGIVTVAGQLSVLRPALAAGTTLSPGPSTYTVSPSSLHALCKEYEGNKILIVTNPSGGVGGVDAQISVSGWPLTAQVLFEDRSLAVASENFSDHFNAWGVHIYQNVSIYVDMGVTDEVRGLKHVVNNVPDGDTQPASIGGRDARKNVDPATDYYFYFDVSDIFACKGSQSDIYILLDYYDTGTGSLGLQYDADDGTLYKGGGQITLSNDNQWKRHIYHVTDAYLGNRQNGGSDFRIAKYGGGVFYLDRVEVWVVSPLPAQVGSPDPSDLAEDVSRTADLSWSPADKATSYNVYFGTGNPPTYQGNQTEVTFDPETMDYLTRYFWRIDSVNDYATTTSQVWSFITESYTGDFDKDLDVDQEDFGYLQACLAGPYRPYEPGCAQADLDKDTYVDLYDFSIFQACMGGANQPPRCQ